MSYDLFFQSRSGDPLSPEDFLGYFEGRANYEMGEGAAVWYENPATGVYFSFDHSEGAPSFNLNYFRPHTFGLEAEAEVSRFVRHFNLLVSDPQMDGMGEGEYSPEGFLRGWNAGNDFGYMALLRQGSETEPLQLPGALLERVWRWNYQRDALQEQVGDEMFVPRILFMVRQGQPYLSVAWQESIAIALPEVDYLIVGRSGLGSAKQEPDHALIEFARLRPLLGSFARIDGEPPHWRLDFEEPPRELRQFISAHPPMTERLSIVPADQVLNRELVEKHQAK